MAFTVGSLGRRVTWVSTAAVDTSYLTLGWYYPTSVTTGMVWSSWHNASTVVGSMTQGSSASQLLMYPNVTSLGPTSTTATLDSSYFPSGFVANNWYFVATLTTISSAQVWQYAVWVGTESTPPVATSTFAPASPALAPAGTQLTQGLFTGATTAFAGELGQFSAVFCTNDVNMPLGIPAGGATLSQNEVTLVYQRWVQPFWLGRPQFIRPMSSPTGFCEYVSFFNNNNAYYKWNYNIPSAPIPSLNATITTIGSTVTATEQPRVWDNAWCMRERARKR